MQRAEEANERGRKGREKEDGEEEVLRAEKKEGGRERGRTRGREGGEEGGRGGRTEPVRHSTVTIPNDHTSALYECFSPPTRSGDM